MKSAVETLGPTRIKLTVEVPFEELEPAVTRAYKKVGQQVRVKGFRPGKVPPRLVDQYVGRGAVLDEAINDAVPRIYGDAVREQEVDILGHPEIEVTQFTDGEELVFTAEVDVRPEIDLPPYDGLPVTVDAAEFSETEIDEQVDALRDRFSTLTMAERAAATGDFVSIDLSATIEGETVADASANSLSYEVGSDSLVAGLDEAIVGLSAEESKEFETQLRSGHHGGENATATVTVRSVKEKQAPELDDEFAQMASEFDTIAELREDIGSRLGRVRRLTQGMEARDKVLEALLALVEIPLPEHVLGDEVTFRKEQLDQQLEAAGLTKADYAEHENTTPDAIDKDIEDNAATAIKAQFVLDAIAKKEELSVDESDLTEQIVRRAQQAGIPADAYAQQVVNAGQLGALMSDILRNKALALVMERASVTDTAGNPVDLNALTGTAEPATAGTATSED
ncbi:MAG TPA: trigger factor [Mycobacteriales bacterium]|nr:trigger factor [Mycobacteriales bacterium]